jgi:hypothetical protein
VTREHAPRPGVTWQEQPTRTEVVVRDADGGAGSLTPRLESDPVGPFEPAVPMNREQRRRAMRAQRKGGKR